eukprot:scaffold4222_cov115-Cylindrotheca_fusiformis.AAC.8
MGTDSTDWTVMNPYFNAWNGRTVDSVDQIQLTRSIVVTFLKTVGYCPQRDKHLQVVISDRCPKGQCAMKESNNGERAVG